MEPAQADAYFAQKNAAPSAVLLDASGEIGRLYDAKTTPHMFVINPDGILVYNGAIDDKPTSDQADLATATNYVSAALGEGMAGKALTTATSRPYGCGINTRGNGASAPQRVSRASAGLTAGRYAATFLYASHS